MRCIALAALLAADPLAAQTPGPAAIVELLRDETPEGRLAGAVLACAATVHDPGIAGPLFTEGAWQPAAPEYEGTAEYRTLSMWAAHWLEPGFCMVQTDAMGTEAALAVLLAAVQGWPGLRVLDAGADCTVVDLGQGTLAQLTGEGQDPACSSATAAALRFTIADQ